MAKAGTVESRPSHVHPGGVLLIAVLAMSWAGPLVRFTDAPALVVAAWRLLLSVVLLVPLVARFEGWSWLKRLDRTDVLLTLLGGLLLAAHFWAWIASLSLTTIAASTVLVNTQPFFVVLFSALWLGERPTRRQLAGIGVAVIGALVVGRGSTAAGGHSLVGDLLAVAGAVAVAGYYVVGRRLRQHLDVWSYVLLVYGAAALILVLAVLASPDATMTGHGSTDWLVFGALALGPMLIGHTGVNYALRYVPAYLANLAILGEPVIATLIAWLLPAIAERPGVHTIVGGAIILAGVVLSVWRRPRPRAGRDMPVAQGAMDEEGVKR